MTERLFYEDVTCSVFSAKVTCCAKTDAGYEIILDKTLFYPEGGGQPADNGTLGEAKIFDVQYKNDDIVHYSNKPLQIGEEVEGAVDMRRRRRLVQQHSGEHIVSGIIHNKFGYDNVGFHMGSECITIDFNGHLDADDLAGAEREANYAVYENFEPHIFYPSETELKELEYRSKKELEGDIRIVSFGKYDTCACCGLHVMRTGEIGVIKITGFQKYKGGTRVTMLSGIQALEDYAIKDELVHGISNMLSSRPYDIKNAVQRLADDRNSIKEKLVAARNTIFQLKRETVREGSRCAIFFEENAEPFELRIFADMLLDRAECSAVFCGNDTDGYKYAIGSRSIDIVSFVKEANKALNGRGGGKDGMVQGSFGADAKSIEEYIRNELG